METKMRVRDPFQRQGSPTHIGSVVFLMSGRIASVQNSFVNLRIDRRVPLEGPNPSKWNPRHLQTTFSLQQGRDIRDDLLVHK